MSTLRPRHGRSFWTSRGISMVAIVGLHVLALAVGLAIRGPRPDSLVEAPPIRVEIISTVRPVAVQPDLKVRLQDPTLPQPITPIFQITVPDEPPVATITLAAAPAPAVESTEQPMGEGPVSVSEPDYVELPRPVYPQAARRARAQGLVHVRALVDVEGRAQEATVARSSGFELLDRAACEAVRRALFKPYRRNNVARSMLVIVPVEFSLTRSEFDVRRKDHHAMRGHAEELGGLSAASLHVGE